ncbi:Methyl-accepting chemotaxis protein [Durusdinium trenchii]|uniref:Methyl-accepting chemotaxis protein n=1 Tax=Durusdinium trenchii TaxID=1381693 RepID=A0ABP0K8U8_9DINO
MSDAVQQQAYQQEAVLQNIQRNLVLIYVGLITSMGTFERNQATFAETDSFEGLQLLDAADAAWSALRHVIFDDKCDESVGSDIVVSAMAAKDTYVAIGGMGCDRVCRPISSLATSLRLPFLSYECASPDFSDTLAYPALARMGTVTTPGILNTIKELKAKNDWKNLFVISGDPAFYQETYTQEFTNMGFAVQTLSAYESRWTEIENQMAMVKGSTTGLERVIFVLGSETFFRKLAFVLALFGFQPGPGEVIGGKRRTCSHRQWLREDVGGLELKQAFAAFKDELLYADGTERYHGIHGQYHPTYRKKLYDRGYYDIFFFDLNGDLIYSVFKETDYATNFKAVGSGPWADSGLGQAFRGGLQNPEPWAESFRGR